MRQFSIVVDATLEIDEIEVIVDRRIWFRFEPRSDFPSSCGAISSCDAQVFKNLKLSSVGQTVAFKAARQLPHYWHLPYLDSS